MAGSWLEQQTPYQQILARPTGDIAMQIVNALPIIHEDHSVRKLFRIEIHHTTLGTEKESKLQEELGILSFRINTYIKRLKEH